ncbi:MAG TPA: lysophospholipid acyltransferase family protein [Streptosporangiaceae bacterium]|nr:lysophospholipid acyltransferase family protein [Streptosporangiaceae bacterium]
MTDRSVTDRSVADGALPDGGAADGGGPGRGVLGAAGAGAAERIASLLTFLRRRLNGEYEIDEFGFDPDLNETVLMPLVRWLYQHWFEVRTRDMGNVPACGGALVVCNHSGTLPVDAMMLQVSLLDEHPAHRHLRLLGADLVYSMPVLSHLARKTGHALASPADAERLLRLGELVGVCPEGYKGLGKPFSQRYNLQRFGRGGFAASAIGAGVPIIPCAIVGAEEIFPMLGNARPIARLLGLPYFPITPLFPWFGPIGAIPLPSRWLIGFGEPVPTDGYEAGAADDPAIVFELTDQVREIIQQLLRQLLAERGNAFG